MPEKKNGQRRMTYDELHSWAMEQKERADKAESERSAIEAKFVNAIKYSCPEKYMKIFHDHGIRSSEDLDAKLDKLRKLEDSILALRQLRKDFVCLADIITA